jgi:hypothetical protein
MGIAAGHGAAQTTSGTLCVSTYADANANGVRDDGEGPLAGVNVNLETGGAIIATHVTEPGEEQYCFANLLTGTYTVTFTDAPTYRLTTANTGTFALDAGQRLTIDPLGAVPVPLADLRAVVAAQLEADDADKPLDSSTRLLYSTAGAMIVMLFLIGLGAVILGLRDRRRPGRPIPPPPDIRPPGF